MGDTVEGRVPGLLSVIVAIVSDTTDPKVDVSHLAGCLEALEQQVDPPALEIIVPHLDDTEGIAPLAERFPDVRFLPVHGLREQIGHGPGREHHDVLRARGLAVARGEVVGLMEDHARPDPHWCANVFAAHRATDHAGIGGAMDNGIDRPLNWAVFFCDYGRYQNPVPEGVSSFASDSNVSYKADALESVRSTWQDSFREVIVNAALAEQGRSVALRRDVVMNQYRKDLTLGEALKERYVWGRSYAETRNLTLGTAKRLVYALLSPLLPALLVLRHGRTARERGRYFGKFVRSLPQLVLLLLVWSLGESVGYVTGKRATSLHYVMPSAT